MSDGQDTLTRRRKLLEGMIDRRRTLLYQKLGLDKQGQPVQGMYGHRKVSGAEARDYWQSVVSDPGLDPMVKAQKFLALPEETQAEIRSGWGSGDGVHS